MVRLIEEKRKELPPEQLEQIEQGREKAFKMMEQRNFEKAIEAIEDIKIQPPPPLDLKEKAELLVNYSQFILGEYKWALDPNIAYQLTNLVSEVRSALNNGDIEVLKDKVKEIEESVNNLPELIQLLLGIKSSIENRIRPYAPNKANELQEELQIIERDCKSGNLSNFNPAILELVKKMTKVIGEVTPPDKNVCPRCKAKLGVEMVCPACGHDLTHLINQPSGASSSSEWSA